MSCEFETLTQNSDLGDPICLLLEKNIVENNNQSAYYCIGNAKAEMTDWFGLKCPSNGIILSNPPAVGRGTFH